MNNTTTTAAVAAPLEGYQALVVTAVQTGD